MIRNFTADCENITAPWGYAFTVRLLDHVWARITPQHLEYQ
jgi:ribonucleoside-triphosphate reductase